MASDTTQPTQEPSTWDSDIDVSSDEESTSTHAQKQTPKTSPPPPPQHDDPQHLRLSLLDSYTQSAVYSKIRKRRTHEKRRNEESHANHTSADASHNCKKPTICELKTHRILYEMKNFESIWIWIDSLPTDERNDYEWIHQYSNLNLFACDSDTDEKVNTTEPIDIDTANISHVERITISAFESTVNEARKSVINSPLYPKLGCCGYVKEFYVTLCDWNTEGVLSIKYLSDEANRSRTESQSLLTRHGYWQRLRYQLAVSSNGRFIAILFDRYCVIRSDANHFCQDLSKIALPISFWEYTQFRHVAWSAQNELLALASHSAQIIILDDKCDQILAFNCDETEDARISGLVWRRLKANNDESYWLQVMILFENGHLHHRSLQLDSVSSQVIDFMEESHVTTVQFPHRSVRKWIYDGIDYFESKQGSYVAISCAPNTLLDTKPRQTRLGSGLMLLQFDGTGNENECVVIKHYNSRIPSNSYFKVDSVCFTMADRRCKLHGRHVRVSTDGKHILCVDLRGNMELFAYHRTEPLELVAKMSNTREMSYGSYPSHSRIFDMQWYDDTSIIIVFANNTFCITPIVSMKHYHQREMKWSLNYLGPQREQLYGLPLISRAVSNSNSNATDANRMFFILEISEAYLLRKMDQDLKYIEEATNDIDRKQNEIYGHRKYRKIALSTFSSMTSLQLFEQYLNQNEYEKALQIANKFKLDTDTAYQSQFQYLIHQYNESHNNNANSDNNNNNNNNNSNHHHLNRLTETLRRIHDELWIVDQVLNASICNLRILDGLLAFAMDILQHSETLRDARPNAFGRFLKYRERVMTLAHIMNESAHFDITQFVDDNGDNNADRYLVFRDANIVDIAYNVASNESLYALHTIFKYHWHEMAVSDRLRILSFIPLTIHPDLYEGLLPSITAPIWGDTTRWNAQQFGLSVTDDAIQIDAVRIINWYKMRIYDIEHSTGNVENSLILCNMAVSNKGIRALRPLLESLLLFHKITYEWKCDCDDKISLLEFENMNASDKLFFVLKDSRCEHIMHDIEQRWRYFVSSPDELASKLLRICLQLSDYGRIDLVAAILSAHDAFGLRSALERDCKELLNADSCSDLWMEYALLNAKQCTNESVDGWNGLERLLRVIQSQKCDIDSDDTKVSHFAALIKSGAALSRKYDIARSLIFYDTLFTIGHANANSCDWEDDAPPKWKEILNVSIHGENIESLQGLAVDITRHLLCSIHRFARKFTSNDEWNALRCDLFHFRNDIFSFIDEATMEFEFYCIVFKCCAFDFIESSIAQLPISNEELIDLSLSTASELIDSSTGCHDISALNDAHKCLAFIPSKYQRSDVWRLRDLIFAVQLLWDAFHYDDVAPFQLRKIFDIKNNDSSKHKHFTSEQFDFIRSISSHHYVKKDDLLQLLDYLQFADGAYKVEMLCICADFALQETESDEISIENGLRCQLFAYNVYCEIFADYKVTEMGIYIEHLLWNICRKLMKCACAGGGATATSHLVKMNKINKFELLSHSLTTASRNKMYHILKEWQCVRANDTYMNTIGSDWGHFIADVMNRRPSYARMSGSNIKQQIEMNEMQKLVNVYFECDTATDCDLHNDEMFAFLSKSNQYWNELEMLSAALISCRTPKPSASDHFEELIQSIIDNVYLNDDIYVMTFLLLTDNIHNAHQSFIDILSHKNIAIYKKSKIAQIAAKYFVFQSVHKFMTDEQYNAYAAMHLSATNISGTQIFEMKNMLQLKQMIDNIETIAISDDAFDDESVAKCCKNANYFYNKWRKFTQQT